MKIFIINTDYLSFLRVLYRSNPGLSNCPYDEQMEVRNQSLFGSSDFYSYNFNLLGHMAIDVHFNNYYLQSQWAKEGIKNQIFQLKYKQFIHLAFNTRLGNSIRSRLFLSKFPLTPYLYTILNAQIQSFSPDIILNQPMVEVPLHHLILNKSKKPLIVGQIASALPKDEDLLGYDLLISSLPNMVSNFKKMGIDSYYSKLAFDARILEGMLPVERDLPIVFIGNITSAHKNRVKLLEYLCQKTEIQIWGSLHNLHKSSPIYGRYNGEAWGIDMYRILLRAKIAINIHIDLSENYANNMRLFEATGCGAMLLTDDKDNISDLFELNKEIVTYSTPEDCAIKIQKYLQRNDEREAIAKSGQMRTLCEHTYRKRTEELSEIFEHKLMEMRGRKTC